MGVLGKNGSRFISFGRSIFVRVAIILVGQADLLAERLHDLMREDHVFADKDLPEQAPFLFLDLEGLIELHRGQRGVLEQQFADAAARAGAAGFIIEDLIEQLRAWPMGPTPKEKK